MYPFLFRKMFIFTFKWMRSSGEPEQRQHEVKAARLKELSAPVLILPCNSEVQLKDALLVKSLGPRSAA